MPLSDIIGRAIEGATVGGGVDTHKAVLAALPLVKVDTEAVDMLLTEALTKRIKEASSRGQRRISGDEAQGSFFGDKLRRGYALDTDGRVVKNTSSITRIEFARLIAIREKQLNDDAAHLTVLREAQTAVAPFWDKHPLATYGEVEAMFIIAVRTTDTAA